MNSMHTNIDVVTRQCPIRKTLKFVFDCTQTMINTLIIFLTQYFQPKKNDLLVRISPFNPRVQSSILFFKFFWSFHYGKKTSTQLIQAKCSGDKGTFPKEETKWQPQPCSLREKATKLPQGAIFLGEKGTKFPKGATSPQGQMD